MNDQAPRQALPPVVDRQAWQEAREALFVREKAHTREGDAIAAARRRLPMVEVDATIQVIGPNGPITILDVFEGRSQLIAYFHAWWPGQPAAEQCEGCTFFNSQVRELSYIHSRDATYAVLCKGPYEESVRYRDFLGLDMPWYSVETTAAQLLEGRDWQRHQSRSRLCSPAPGVAFCSHRRLDASPHRAYSRRRRSRACHCNPVTPSLFPPHLAG